MKKVLSLVLVIALVLGSFSFAFGMTDIAGVSSEEAIQTLVSLGVLQGYPDGTYKPAKAVKRSEMAKVLIEALGYGELATATTSSFSDVPDGHWAAGYIEFAAGLKIINGYPDGTFRPEAQVSYNEALTMVLRALGYTDDALQGSWPTNYVVKALDLDLNDDVTLAAGGADRAGVAQILFNALEIDTVKVNNDGDVTTTGALLIDKLGATSEEQTITLDHVFDTDEALDSDVDLTSYVFHTVTTYTNEDGTIVYVSGGNTTETGEISDVNEITLDDEDDTVVTFAGITDKTQILYNGAPADGTLSADLTTGAIVTLVYEDSDKTTVAGIVVEEVTDTVLISAEYDSEEPAEISGIDLPVKDNDDDEEITDLDNVVVKGDATSLEDIAENDVVHVYEADDTQKTTLEVVRNTFTGEVSEKKSNGDIVVDGEVLDFNADVSITVDLGEEYTFALDADGDIFAVIEGEAAEAEYSYAIVVDAADGATDTDAWGNETTTLRPQVKLETVDGELVYTLFFDEDDDDEDGVVIDGSTLSAVDASLTSAGLTAGKFIAYTTNSDGEIETIDTITSGTAIGSVTAVGITNETFSDPLLSSMYLVTDDSVLLENEGGLGTTTSALDTIGTTVSGIVVYNSDDEIVAMSVTFNDGTEETETLDTYALILEQSEVLKDGDPINKYLVFEDGVEKTYESTDDYTVGQLGTVTITDDELDLGIVSTDAATVKVVSGDFVKLDDNNYHKLSEDVVVYILESDEYTVGNTSDVEVDAEIDYYEVDDEVVVVIVKK